MTEQIPPLAEFVPPEPELTPSESLELERVRPTDFLLLIPLLVIGLGLGIGWFMKWKDLTPPLPRDWSPACEEEPAMWQLFRPPPELSYHSQPGEWVLGYAEVAVRWHGPQSYGPQTAGGIVAQDALTTSTGEPTFITTLVGNQQHAYPAVVPIDAGLTSNTVWFLGEIGTSGTILELAARGSGSQVVTPLHLPSTLPDANGNQVPVTWLARDYGDDKLLLIGLDQGHPSPEFAELQVITLPTGTVESTVRVPLKLHRFFGEVDETTGTILLTRASTPAECWRVNVATGSPELLTQMPSEVVELSALSGQDELWYQPVPDSIREQSRSTGIAPPVDAAVGYYSRPGVVLDYVVDARQNGMTLPVGLGRNVPWLQQYNPLMQAHPQEFYLRPELGYGIPPQSRSMSLESAVLQSASGTTGKPVDLDPDTFAAMQGTVATGVLFPLKLHPISIDDVLVTQLVRPGSPKAGGKSGMARLGWLDQKTLAITWLAWWALPRQEFGNERQADATFAMTGDTGWLLVAGAKDGGMNITPATTCYAAHMISAFPDWLKTHLGRKSTP